MFIASLSVSGPAALLVTNRHWWISSGIYEQYSVCFAMHSDILDSKAFKFLIKQSCDSRHFPTKIRSLLPSRVITVTCIAKVWQTWKLPCSISTCVWGSTWYDWQFIIDCLFSLINTVFDTDSLCWLNTAIHSSLYIAYTSECKSYTRILSLSTHHFAQIQTLHKSKKNQD